MPSDSIGQWFMQYPGSDKIRKFMFKFPLILWRLGFGPILGKIFVVITARGRKSGQPRHTMVEYHSVNGKRYVLSAYGEDAQWYKNIKANPLVTVQTGTGAQAMRAVRVSDSNELLAVYTEFNRTNPEMTAWYMHALNLDNTPEAVLAHKDKIIMLRFDPTDEATPMPLTVDLAWIWLPLMLLIGLLRIIRKLTKRSNK